MQRPLSFRKEVDALETLTIWAWALARMGQEHGHLSSPEWDHASRASLPAPQPCPLLPASPLQAGSVLSTQPLLRSQFSAQRKCFLCAHFSRWPPTLAWIEKHRNQTADRRLPWQCLIGTQACKLTPALLTLPHPPPPFAFVDSEPGAGPGAWAEPSSAHRPPTEHLPQVLVCGRYSGNRYSISEWMNECMFFFFFPFFKT